MMRAIPQTLVAAWLAGAVVLLVVPTAWADDAELEALLEESVVTGASKTAETASDAPGSTRVITGDQLRRHGLTSLDEAINYLGGGLITEWKPAGIEIGGRGVTLTGDYGNHVLVVVDGHALNEQWDGTAYFEKGLGLPLELVDHIELVIGPGSVLYGSNATLGVINIVTKRASDYRGAHAIAEVGYMPLPTRGGGIASLTARGIGHSERVGLGYGSDGELFGYRYGWVTQAEMWRFTGPAVFGGPQRAQNGDGTPMQLGPAAPPGLWAGRFYDAYSIQAPSLYSRLTLGELTLTLKASMFRRTTPNILDQFDDKNTFERDRFVYLDLQWHKSLSARTTLDLRTYGDLYDYREDLNEPEPQMCGTALGNGCLFRFKGASRWGGAEPRVTYDWFGDGMMTTMVGGDLRLRWARHGSETLDGPSGAYIETVGKWSQLDSTQAGYLQHRYSPSADWHLNAGVRTDHDPRVSKANASPRAAVTWDAWRGGAVKLVYASAFRAPTAYEMYFEGFGSLPNQQLKAETVRSVEGSVEHRFGTHRIGLSLFRSWWQNLIVSTTLPDGNQQYSNTLSIENYGLDASFDGHRGDYRYGFNVTEAYARAIEGSEKTQLPVAPAIYGNARLSRDGKAGIPTVALAARAVGPRLFDTALTAGYAEPLRAPAHVGLRLAVSDQFPGSTHWSWRVTGDWISASRSPYAIGPNRYAATGPGQSAELMPLNRYTGFVALAYDGGEAN